MSLGRFRGSMTNTWNWLLCRKRVSSKSTAKICSIGTPSSSKVSKIWSGRYKFWKTFLQNSVYPSRTKASSSNKKRSIQNNWLRAKSNWMEQMAVQTSSLLSSKSNFSSLSRESIAFRKYPSFLATIIRCQITANWSNLSRSFKNSSKTMHLWSWLSNLRSRYASSKNHWRACQNSWLFWRSPWRS